MNALTQLHFADTETEQHSIASAKGIVGEMVVAGGITETNVMECMPA